MSEMDEDILQPSTDDFLSGIAIRSDLLQELYSLSRLDPKSAEKIAATLRSLIGLNSNETIQAAIGQTLDEGEKINPADISRVLIKLDTEEIPQILKTFEKWLNKDNARRKLFDDSSVKNLKANLQTLVAKFPAIELMRKANQLVRDTAGEFESVKFVCDMRPVFNEPRTNVDAFVLIANLRIRYVMQSGEREVCEIALTEEELLELKEKSEKALDKMKVLRRIGASLDTTKFEEEESDVN